MKLRILTAACLAALCLCLPAAAAGAALPETAPPEAGETVTVQCQAELFQEGSLTGNYTRPGPMPLDDGVEGELYSRMVEALRGASLSQKEIQISVSDLGLSYNSQADRDDVMSAFERAGNDNPEYFYLENSVWFYHSGGKISSVVIRFDTETYSQSDVDIFNERVEELTAQADGMGALEKALFFHDWLAVNVAYNWDVANGREPDTDVHSAYSALVRGDAVCEGYSLAYKLLLDRTGVECTAVTSDDLNHMWNAVCLDGQWYYVDVTWDDPVEDKLGRCLHDNFLLSEDGLRATGHDSTDWTFNPENDNSVAYESGWAFNDGADTPFHRWDGVWYHVANRTRVEDGTTYVSGSDLYAHESLEGEGRQVAYLGRDGVYTAAWEDGWAYCLGYFYGELLQVELATGKIRTVADLDSRSSEKGLYYDRAKGEIQVWTDQDESTGARSMLNSYRVKEYPPAWDEVPGDATALAGAVENEAGGLRIGLMWAEGPEASAPWLAAAFYDGGRLAALRTVKLQGLEDGLNVLDLDGLPGGYTRAALFLLDGDGTLTPLAGKLSLENGGA